MFVGVIDSHPVVKGPPLTFLCKGQRHAIMPGEDWIDERVLRINEVQDRPVASGNIDEESQRFLEHGFTQIVGKILEPLSVDGVVLLETTEIEPVAGELRGQAADTIVTEHALGLREEYGRLVQVTGSGMREKLCVGHAGPEEVT